MLSIKVTDFFELQKKKNKNGENSIEYFEIANTCTVNHHNFIIQLMHSFEVNIRICQPEKVMSTEAKPRWASLSRID